MKLIKGNINKNLSKSAHINIHILIISYFIGSNIVHHPLKQSETKPYNRQTNTYKTDCYLMAVMKSCNIPLNHVIRCSTCHEKPVQETFAVIHL